MEEKVQTKPNNQVSVAGRIDKEFNFSHEYFGEGFYTTNILVDRLNETTDSIPVLVSDRLLDMDSCYAGKYIALEGEFRSYNSREIDEDSPKKRQLTVFAREIHLLKGQEKKKNLNEDSIFIDGYLCKPPVYRITPLGREITELTIAVSRYYGKCDYIPCICWGRNARFAAGFATGDRINIHGRIQSRDYTRRSGPATNRKLTTYEVSVQRIYRQQEE